MSSAGATAVVPPPDPVVARSDSAPRPEEISPSDRHHDRPALLIGAMWLLLILPLLVALGVLHQPRWYPIGDLAQTELRVRDVGTAHSPLIGLVGRLGTFAQPGSHPGPLSFWVLAPFYRLFGASAFALQAASVVLSFVAVAGSLVVAHRRGGARLVLGVTAALALLLHGYGTLTLVEAWNPYLPVMWWFLFLLAVWSVLVDDMAMLPVAVFAGSFCLETHISYLGLGSGLAAVLAAAVALAAHRRRGDPGRRRQFLIWSCSAVALAIVVWVPPVVEQLTSTPGNLTVIARTFRHPSETPIGLHGAVDLLLVHLDGWRMITGDQATGGSLVPGVVLLVAWLGSVVAAWRLRHRVLLGLDLVLGVALVLGLISLSRIFGPAWPYLMLWTWGITALLMLVVGWTAGLVAGRWLPRARALRWGQAVNVALLATAVVSTAAFVLDAAHAEVAAPRLSAVVGRVAGPTERALDGGSVPGGGRRGRYLVTWDDQVAPGSRGDALLLDLERRGFHVGVPQAFAESVARHRWLKPSAVTGVVHLSVGPDIAVWRAKPGAREVAYVDDRTPAQRVEYQRLQGRVLDQMRAAGLAQAVPEGDQNLVLLAGQPGTPVVVSQELAHMLDIGLPVAVFIGPPNTA